MYDTTLQTLQTFLDPWLLLLSEDPVGLAAQGGAILFICILIFLVFFTTRDILLRTHSFWYTLFSILLVALVPVAGFLLYFLIRPPRTLKEREMEEMVRAIFEDHMKKEKRNANPRMPKRKPSPKGSV
jgi:uncharacterized integral membrane protein